MKKMNRSSRQTRIKLPRFRLGIALLFLAALLLCPGNAGAVGLRMPHQDPEAIARGNAFVATADNPSAIYYNPAGITQLQGDQFRAGIYLISADTKYTSPGGATAQTDTTPQAVPQLYYVHSFENSPFTVGLGVYAPYGLGLDWGNNPPFAPIAQKGSLIYATVSPVIAWRVHPTLSIAIGPTISYSDADLKTLAFKFKGSDTGFGFKAGLLWQPHQRWSFGASYQSATDLEYSGHSEVPAYALGQSHTTGAAHFPQFAVAGVSFRPTINWNFEFDVDWTDWDSLNQVVFQRADTVAVPFVFNYTSSLMYEFGVTRQLGRGWFASVGYIYSENSSPNADFNPFVPDDNLHVGSVGVGHRGKRWDWAVGYHFAYNGKRNVTGSNSPYGLANGTYETFNNGINIAGTFKF